MGLEPADAPPRSDLYVDVTGATMDCLTAARHWLELQAGNDPDHSPSWGRFYDSLSRSLGDNIPPDSGLVININRPLMLMVVTTWPWCPLHTEDVFHVRDIYNPNN